MATKKLVTDTESNRDRREQANKPATNPIAGRADTVSSQSKLPVPVATPVDPLQAALAQLYSGPTPDFQGSATGQMSSAYAPVLADLAKQQQLATQRAGQNDSQLAGMYAALQKSIGLNNANLQRQTSNVVGQDRSITNQGLADVNNAYNSANSDIATQLQKLGIQDAAPNALGAANHDRGLLAGVIAANGANAQNTAMQLGANAGQFNVAQQNIAGFAGNDQRALNARHLQDILAGIGTKSADVKSQTAQNAMQLAAQLQSQYLNNLNTQANNLVNSYGMRQKNELAADKLGLQQDKLNLQAQQQQYNQTGAGDQAYARAAQLFGTSGDAASRAMSLVMQAGADKQPSTAMDLVHQVLDANHRLKATNPSQALPDDALQNLALTLYAQMKPSAPNYMQQYMAANP